MIFGFGKHSVFSSNLGWRFVKNPVLVGKNPKLIRANRCYKKTDGITYFIKELCEIYY